MSDETPNPRYALCTPTTTLQQVHFLLPGAPGPTAGFIRTDVTDYCEVTVSYRDASGADLGYAPQLAITTPASTPMRFLGRFASTTALQSYAAAADNVGACALIGTALYHSTGTLWVTPSGGGGGGPVNYPEVLTFAALPTGQPEGTTYVVLQASGVPFINRKAPGMYRQTSGVWAYLGEVPEGYFADNVLRFFDNADPTKQLALELSTISPGTVRTMTLPDASGTVALTSDPRFTDTREPSTATVTQVDAEAGTSTSRFMWTPQRVWQAINAWVTANGAAIVSAINTALGGTGWQSGGGGGGGGNTNLTYTASPTGGTVVSDSGTDAPLPLADGTNAGLLSPAGFTRIAGAMPTGTLVDVSAPVTLNPDFNGFRFKATSTQPFTVPTGLGGAFVGVTVRGPCTWVQSGTTVTDRRQTGQGFDFCQLVQVAANEFVVVGTST
jgi:hypothetical protein